MAKQLNCRTLASPEDYWDSMNVGKNFSDGLHFSESGSHIFFNIISQELIAMTKDLPIILPDWKDLSKS